jgi:hypothetical protein
MTHRFFSSAVLTKTCMQNHHHNLALPNRMSPLTATDALKADTSSSFLRNCSSSISMRLFWSSIARSRAEKSRDMSIGAAGSFRPGFGATSSKVFLDDMV